MAILVGVFFTAVIQSSSACTVMVVSFVNSGLMNLTQAAGVTLKGIQSIDYSWGEIDFEYKPMNGMLMADEYLAAPMAISGTSYDMDIEPDDIEVSDTVTVIWEIE